MTRVAHPRTTAEGWGGGVSFEPFMAFYDRTCDLAYRLACWVTGDPNAAGEAVVRAYVRAYADGRDTREHGHALILGLIRDELAGTGADRRTARRAQLEAS